MIRFLIPFMLGACCHGSEISIDQITAAVCQVESGCFYHRYGFVSGKWKIGSAKEVGYWQISPMVLRDLKATVSQAGDTRVGERLFRKWYAHLYLETGNHTEALAAYHRGLGGRFRTDAKEYSSRVLNLAATLQSKAAQQ